MRQSHARGVDIAPGAGEPEYRSTEFDDESMVDRGGETELIVLLCLQFTVMPDATWE